jgi:hypothetical protein
VNLTVTDARGFTSADMVNITVQDTEPPSLTIPSPMVVSAAPAGCDAAVSFTVTASDTSSVTVVNTPASGATFPKGVTTVTSVATDTSGNKTTKTFTVTVNDTQAPSLILPAPIVVRSAAGHCDAAVSFTVIAADNCPGVTIVNTPASGSTFPIGTNTVTSVAADAAGNKATNTFKITVKENVAIGNAVVVARNSVWLKQKAETPRVT